MIYSERFWPENAGEFNLLNNRPQDFKPSDRLRSLMKNGNVDSNTFNDIVKNIFHYDVLPSTDLPVLICWFVGSAAVLTEKLSKELAGQICHEVLCSALKISQDQHRPTSVVKYFSLIQNVIVEEIDIRFIEF